jgi:hypothetical protein
MIFEISLISVSTVIAYILTFFVLSRCFVAFLGWRKERIPSKIPKSMHHKIISIKKKSKGKKEFLLRAFRFLTKKYHGRSTTYLTAPEQLFMRKPSKIWKLSGAIPCMTLNHLLRIFLRKSKLFSEKEIKLKHSFHKGNIHQHMQVKLGKKWIDVDPWSKKHGLRRKAC